MPVKKLEISGAAGLDGLNLTPSEIDKVDTELSGILDYVEQMDEVDSVKIGHNIEYIFDKIIIRQHKARPSSSGESVFESAAAKDEDFFRVTKI